MNQLAVAKPLPIAALTYYDRACAALSKARTIDEVSAINNEAAGMQAYARQAKNKQLEIDASEIRFRAVRRLGQLIAAQKATVGLAKGTRGQGRPKTIGGGENPPPKDGLPTLLRASTKTSRNSPASMRRWRMNSLRQFLLSVAKRSRQPMPR
jgi:hypothetical protein